MSDCKLKFEFLKNVQTLSYTDLYEISQITNSDYIFLYNEITKFKSHNTIDLKKKEKAKEDIDKFVARAYKNFLTIMREGRYGRVKDFKSFLEDSLFDPDSEIFKNSRYTVEDLIRNLPSNHPEISQKFGNFAPIYFQNNVFIHVSSNVYYAPKKSKEVNECRLYLNLKLENIVEFARLALRYGQKYKIPLYFKFARNDERNDTFLFYCSYNEAIQVVDLIEKIKVEKPELFEGTENVPPHLGKIKGYIGFGEEPSQVKNFSMYSSGASYTEVRADFLEELQVINEKLRAKQITREQSYKLKKEALKKYDVARPKYLFLNQSTIEEFEKTGLNIDEIGKNTMLNGQYGQ